jgi:2-C-methyl-D-erythritol 2,4-cyclodiphosphate synthase
MRIGHGYDVHRLSPGVPLVLGGVNIPHKSGLIGWSDADVLVHAVIDSLLGAAGLGDIGMHFPPGDPLYKGISSLALLQRVGGMLKHAGFGIVNIDSTVVAEQPRLREYIDGMRRNLAESLDCPVARVNVKASTQEQLGFAGREEGMMAWAVSLLE